MAARRRLRAAGASTASATIEIAGETLPLSVNWRKAARRFTLRLEPRSGGARLTVPAGADLDDAIAFLRRHEGWLERERRRLAAPVAFAPGARIPVRGAIHEIVLSGRRGRGVRAVAGGEARRLEVDGPADMVAIRVARWLRAEARSDLEAAVRRHAARLGAEAGRTVIRDQRSRWGSCSAAGTLSFSWRLIMAPGEVLDYVAAHEVAHLKEMNHGPRFWRLVRESGAEVERARRWLTRNGAGLHRYGTG